MDFVKNMLALPNDDRRKTLFVAVALCLVCSIVVSTAAVALRPLQNANQVFDIRRNIVEIAGLSEEGKTVEEIFEGIDGRVINVQTGEYVEDMDPVSLDWRKMAKTPESNIVLSEDEDIAGIRSISQYKPVYLVRDGESVERIILPVHGYGLWSTLYGFIALEGDARTVVGLGFYEHAETPGLGGEVDNPKWKALWNGKEVYDENYDVAIDVIKGNVSASTPDAQYKVDGLAGATLTANGVENMLQFWLSDQGYGSYLQKFHES